MEIITPGHCYRLANFENDLPGQTLQFIEKVPIEGCKLEVRKPGTSTEEVLTALIDRLAFLNEAFPCRENIHAIYHMNAALDTLNHRTLVRKLQSVKGTAKPHNSSNE